MNPPLLCIKFSDLRDCLKHEGFPYEYFRPCETKIFQQEVVKLPYYAYKLWMPQFI